MAFLPVTRQRHRLHEVALHQHIADGAAHPHIIERRMQLVETQKPQKPVGVINLSAGVAVPLQRGHQVGQRVFDPVDLAGAQRRRRRAAIGNPDHLQPVKMHPLAA